MEFKTDIYGFNPNGLITSKEEVCRRLQAILEDKVLRFNPYSVDDETLLACVERAVWQPSLTQMVVFHFHDIRRIKWERPYDAIFFHVGNDSQELHLPVNSLTNRLTYSATLQQIHVTINGNVLTNQNMVEKMQGKDYFISHALPTKTIGRSNRPAYRMFQLRGDEHQKAELIRQLMIESKITMLKEVLAHPYTPQYLCCERNFIDYTTPITAAIESIQRFPDIRN